MRSSTDATSAEGASPDTAGPLTAAERTAGLEQRLEGSLAEFDALLLKEQELLAQQRETGSSAAGSGGTGGGDDLGAAAGGEAPGGADRTTGASPGTPPGQPPDDVGPVEGADSAIQDSRSDRVPPDVGDGRGDDIVARQLREAAMQEDDPELREKLWQEYRNYKQGNRND